MQRINAWHNCLFLSTPSGWRATFHVHADLAQLVFLSTPSGWRATLVPRADRRRRGHFYPRPPGGGRHSILITTPRWKRNFYPRPPGGGRLSTSTPIWRSLYFYPRPPGGGRLAGGEFPNLPAGISIHALRVEGDLFIWRIKSINQLFLSTPSGWRATFLGDCWAV